MQGSTAQGKSQGPNNFNVPQSCKEQSETLLRRSTKTRLLSSHFRDILLPLAPLRPHRSPVTGRQVKTKKKREPS